MTLLLSWNGSQTEKQKETGSSTKTKRRNFFNFSEEEKKKIKVDYWAKVDKSGKTFSVTTAKGKYDLDIPTWWYYVDFDESLIRQVKLDDMFIPTMDFKYILYLQWEFEDLDFNQDFFISWEDDENESYYASNSLVNYTIARMYDIIIDHYIKDKEWNTKLHNKKYLNSLNSSISIDVLDDDIPTNVRDLVERINGVSIN